MMDGRKLKVLWTKLRRELRARGTAVGDRILHGVGIAPSLPKEAMQPLPYLLYVCELLPARAGRMAKWVSRTSGDRIVLLCHRDGFIPAFANAGFAQVLLYRNTWHLRRIMKAMPKPKQRGIQASIVAFGDNPQRRAPSAKLTGFGLKLVNAIHPTVHCDSDVVIGNGCYIVQGVILITGTHVGDCVNIHTGATIDHDNWIGEGANIGPGVHTAGRVRIGRDVLLGAGAVAIPDVEVGEGVVCGAGTVILGRVEAFTKVVGNPARVIDRLNKPSGA